MPYRIKYARRSIWARRGMETLPSQRSGYIVIFLAVVALVTATVVAVPTLIRASNALLGSAVSTSSGNSARSAAEHALWRLEHDPAVYDQMSGNPPLTEYVLNFSDGPASVEIESSSHPPDDDGLTTTITVSPNRVPPGWPAVVTYTITLTNEDVVPHEVSRLEAEPHVFNPSHVSSSTTGLTTDDPVYVAGRWRWELPAPVTVGPFGGAEFLSWSMLMIESEGNYWMDASARFVNVGTIDAQRVGIRVISLGDVRIWTTVTPDEVKAGPVHAFDFTVTVINTGAADLTLDWIKHWTPRTFDHVTGSTSGATVADPQRSHDVTNDRWKWAWDLDGVNVPVGVPVTLQFQMTAGLLPGIHFSESGVRVQEDDESDHQEHSAGTGLVAPITANRWFAINVRHDGNLITVKATVDAEGAQVQSWEES